MTEHKQLGENLKLVVMSVILTPDYQTKIDLVSIVNNFKITSRVTGIKYGKNIKKGDVNHNTQGFYNNITFTISLKNGRRASVKFYNNLKIHIAGLRGMHEAHLIADLLYGKIHKNGLIHGFPPDIKIQKSEIILMNSGYNSNMTINRPILNEILVRKYNYTALLETSSYSGIKLYPGGKLTILIFKTGKIIVTGSRQMSELIRGYVMIEKILRKHYTKIKNAA